MARTILVLLLLGLAGSVMGSASAPLATFAATSPNTLLATVTLDADVVKAGEELSLTVRLNKAPGSLTVLRLLIILSNAIDDKKEEPVHR